MIFFYRILTFFLYPFFVLFIFLRKILNKEHSIRYKEKIFPWHFRVSRDKNKKLLWFHAASIGEFKSIIPIIEKLNEKDKNLEFLITTVTLSSGELAETYVKRFSNIQHRYLPIDIGFLTNKFINLWKPHSLFLVDSEIWPNLIISAKKNKILLALINARITSKSFKRWMLVKNLAEKIFGSFDFCLSSSKETNDYLKKLMAKNTIYTGNIKLINNSLDKIDSSGSLLVPQKKVWMALSTHLGEEKLCIQTHLFLKKNFKNLMTVIAPRHIERVYKIKDICDQFNLKSQVIKKDDKILDDSEILIINFFGNLNKYLEASSSVFIGKSTLKKFEKVGGQSPIEAAKLGCKIYHGPYVSNFKEIYEVLSQNGITILINNFEELGGYLVSDLNQLNKDTKKFYNFMDSLGQKTLQNTMKSINRYLFNEI